jgi:hypothetical protein
MKRSRTRLRLVWLTLFAFGVQLAVAGFHHHSDRGTGFASRAMTAGLCAPSRGAPCVPGPLRNDNDGCLLCWAASVAATSLAPPVLPAVPLPSARVEMLRATYDTAPIAVVHRDGFQARAPPTSHAA